MVRELSEEIKARLEQFFQKAIEGRGLILISYFDEEDKSFVNIISQNIGTKETINILSTKLKQVSKLEENPINRMAG